jgi:hypothetical protein
MASTQQVEALS